MSALPPLQAIRAFEAAGRHRSVTLAAAELKVTPAAVSRQIRRLEDFLNVDLFIREHRAIRLSGAGEKYLADVMLHLDGLRKATRQVSTLEPSVALRIRVPPTFAARWLIPRLSAFHDANPTVGVQITTSVDWEDLDDCGLDAAVRFGHGRWPGLHATPLVRNVIAPVCSPRLRHAGVVARGLEGRTLLYSLTRPDDWDVWMQHAGLSRPPRVHRLEYESSMLAYQAAIWGLGYGIAQQALIEEELAGGTLVAPFGAGVDMGKMTYYLVVPRHRNVKRELRLFQDWVAEVAAKQD